MIRTFKYIIAAGFLFTLPVHAAATKKFVLKLLSMDAEGAKIASSMRTHARNLNLLPANANSAAHSTEHLVVIGNAKKSDVGYHTVSIEQAENLPNGDIITSKFDLSDTIRVPSKIEVELPMTNHHKDAGLRNPYQVDRTYHNAITDEIDHRIDVVATKEIDGKTYRVIYGSTAVRNNVMSEVSVYERSASGREIIFAQSPADLPDAPRLESIFKLPDNIKGEVVSVNVNMPGNQMSFITSEGHEYIYGVEKRTGSKPGDANPFVFINRNKMPLPFTTEALAKTSVFPARVDAGTAAANRGVDIRRTSAR